LSHIRSGIQDEWWKERWKDLLHLFGATPSWNEKSKKEVSVGIRDPKKYTGRWMYGATL